MKNWKTTSAGIIMIAGAIVGVYFAAKNNALTQPVIMGAITAVIGGVGLIVAQDAGAGTPPAAA